MCQQKGLKRPKQIMSGSAVKNKSLNSRKSSTTFTEINNDNNNNKKKKELNEIEAYWETIQIRLT